jgi:hypothetical protein
MLTGYGQPETESAYYRVRLYEASGRERNDRVCNSFCPSCLSKLEPKDGVLVSDFQEDRERRREERKRGL